MTMHFSRIVCLAAFIAVALSSPPAVWGQETGSKPIDAAATPTKTKIKAVAVTGFDVDSHQWEQSTRLVKGILEETGDFEVAIEVGKDFFASPKLNDYQVVILSYGFWDEPSPSDEAKEGLLNYVKNGGGVVALHFACSAFQDWDEYSELLGRVWKKGVGGHGPFGKFTVNILPGSHAITKGMNDFETEDELYAKLSGDAEIEVLATAHSDWSNQVEPIVFVRKYGNGRVVQNVLGHGLDAKRNPAYRQLLQRCVKWAAGVDAANDE